MSFKIKPDEAARLNKTLHRMLEIVAACEERGCESCQHWNGKGCDASGGQIPPKEIQEKGCGSYENNSVPF